MTDFETINRVLLDRARYGHGYKNKKLEDKRRRAVDYLRRQSGRKWVCDKLPRPA